MSQNRSRLRSIRTRRSSLAAVTDRLAGSVRTAAFWLAVCLPLAYLPAVRTVDDGFDDLLLLSGLLALHVLALSVGHGHRRD